ncbi:hypothetical protein ABFX02_09G017700 [Erythranthe guttata]
MGFRRILILVITLFITISIMIKDKKTVESPQYTVIHTESDFEVRFYQQSQNSDGLFIETEYFCCTWLLAPLNIIFIARCPFKILFQYIEGANLNNSRIQMTVPILTSIVQRAGPLHSSAYSVKFYLPEKFQQTPPLPLPELNLRPDWSKSRCIAVRKFSGFARDENVIKEAEKLAVSLSRSPLFNLTSSSPSYDGDAYSIAQYNSPFRFVSRVNEVWFDVSGIEIEGCDETDNLLSEY